MLLKRSRILDSARAKPTVSVMRRIKSTSSNFWIRKPFFGSSHSFGREIGIQSMFSKKSALSSDETVNSERPRHRNFDQQRTRAFREERMLQTYPALNKKEKSFYFETKIKEVCQASRGLIFTMLVFLKPAKPTLARAIHSIFDPVTTTCFCNHQPTLA